MRKRIWPAFGVLLVVVSCASSYRPIIDMKGVDAARYEADLAECRAYAEEVNPAANAVTGALLTAAFGAALGAATGAIVGDAGAGAAIGAAAGGITGTASGGAGGIAQQQSVIDKCLSGRGYRVLN